jgi:hypothetical protein
MDNTDNDDILIDTETEIELAKKEQEKFMYHINEIETLSSSYTIEDMGNESSEQEYIMYIEDQCKELRQLIDKLYKTKLYIIKNVKYNDVTFYRDKISF